MEYQAYNAIAHRIVRVIAWIEKTGQIQVMKKNRAAAVLIDQGNIALIERKFPEKYYYVFPGGKIDAGEDVPSAVAREVFEELGLRVQVGRLIATVQHKNHLEYFFVVSILAGTFGTGVGKDVWGEESDSFLPVWIPLEKIRKLPVRPKIITDYLIASLQTGFANFQHFEEE